MQYIQLDPHTMLGLTIAAVMLICALIGLAWDAVTHLRDKLRTWSFRRIVARYGRQGR